MVYVLKKQKKMQITKKQPAFFLVVDNLPHYLNIFYFINCY